MENLYKKCKEATKNIPPTKLQKMALGGLLILLGFTFVQSQFAQLLDDYADLLLSAVLPSVIVDLTNAEREDKDLDILTHNSLLDETARLKAEHMRDNEYFAHDSPDGIDPWYWFDEVGYDYVHAGENLAIYFNESEDVVEAWMDSPLHRDNVLKQQYKEIGVAAVEGEYKGFDTIFVVQHFGAPAISETEVVLEAEEASAPITEIPEVPFIEEVVLEETEEEVPVEIPPSVPQPTTPVVQQQVTNVVTQGDMTVYVSDHDATSTDKEELSGIPATTEKRNVPPATTANKDTIEVMNYVYLFFALVVAAMLIVSTIHHQRQHEHVQVAYGVLLLLLATAFITFHAYVVEAFTIF